MKRVLLYSPDVIGHPRVYCRVIADALAGQDCELTLAMGFTDAAGLADSPDLHPLVGRKGVTLLDTREASAYGKPHLSAEELVRLQRDIQVDTTLFIDADKSASDFRRISERAAPRLHGRNLGIFAGTAEWYPGEDSYTGKPLTLRAPTVRTTLGNIKRAIFNRTDTRAYFYEKVLIAHRLLDEIIVKDERLAQWRGAPVSWMPEISRPSAAPETEQESAEYDHWAQRLDDFRQAHQGREPVLYFGDAAYYKGYDLFLEFVARNPNTFAIHAGRSYDPADAVHFKYNVEGLRAQLKAEGRLLETNAYVHTQRLKELFFGFVRVYLTTHRLALSSSTMLQALELGIPVVVPDRGLIGWRVKQHGLGGVYSYEDLDDLARVAGTLWNNDLSPYQAAARVTWEKFSDDAVSSFFRRRLLQ